EERRTDPMTSARIGQLLGAQHVILGAFFVDRKGRLRLDARAVSVETSRLEFAQSVEGKADDVLDVIADLAKRLNAGLALPGSLTGAKPPAPMKRASPFSAMMTYARAVAEDDARRSREALALYRQFLAETEPTFAVAQRRKAVARVRALSGS
ncbi:MAG TPA: hypothetical protein VFV33_05555, partial [Gemmatimonadaceae bacterium]|nr:hypothetical protein [Gemmatimonadaceae bacterium]